MTHPDIIQQMSPIFDWSGLATLNGLRDRDYQELYHYLEKEQSLFLSKEREFRSPDYPWPSDALHWWSRIWEYPYIYWHLRRVREIFPNRKPRALDLGSGVTFFPFAVAKLGFHLSCLDPDPICKSDFDKALNALGNNSFSLDYSLLDTKRYPFPDKEFDVIYCISVLEHIEDYSGTIDEIVRILKNNGYLFLTIDIDLRGDSEIGVEKYNTLKSCLLKYFEFRYPEITVHPMDLLTSENSPYPIPQLIGFKKCSTYFKQRIVKPILRHPPGPFRMPKLAVEGLLMKKRQ